MSSNEHSDLTAFEIVSRHIVMERHLNAFGNLFGGSILAWIDEASALFVMEKIGFGNFVTVSLEHVEFKSPGRRGDAIAIYCRVVRTGRSSITVQTKAFIHEPETGAKNEVIDCQVTYVCLKGGKPYRYFESEEYRRRSP